MHPILILAATEFAPVPALIGGLLIGLSSGLALLLNGRIPGISGVLGRIFRSVPGDRGWRIAFVLGLIAGGAVTYAAWPARAEGVVVEASYGRLVAAGLLIGLGARLSGGCTSGHGVCGLGRVSKRGSLGTVVFMAVAILVVYVSRHALGGAA